MNYEIINKEKFKIIGIEVRTINQDNQAAEDIGNLWKRFFEENIISQIPHKSGSSIISLYTDYEGDFTKPYSCVIGCEVSAEQTPEGLVIKEIPESKYAVFTAPNNSPESLFAVWNFIWNSDLKRTYTGDFEVYEQNTPEVKIYVAIE